MVQHSISLYRRPGGDAPLVVDQIVAIARELTGEWFAPDVPEALPSDLKFHDALCLEFGRRVASFITFTSMDGSLLITLMGTDPSVRGQGHGSRLMRALFDHARELGFADIVVQTVPPSAKPGYAATVRFYQEHGFVIEKEYKELWETGALELRKRL